MKWRKIEENEVREAIINPDKLEDAIRGRKNAFKKVEGRSLKVTYLPGDRDEITVITTMVTGE